MASAEQIIDDVLRHLNRLGGFDAWWEDIDRDTRQEIRDDLSTIVSKRLAESASDKADWIACSERMPPTGCSVIVDGGAAYFDGQVWRTLMNAEHRAIQWAVTHWMPWPKLPPPPTSEK